MTLCASIAAAPVMAAGVADEVAVPPTASNQRSPMATDSGAVPAPQAYGKVEVINGGVDSDQAMAIKRIAPQYKLRVELSGRGGEYEVADRLKLLRGGQGGDVIAEIPDAGPWLLLDVPPGHYTLAAEFDGRPVQRDVTVANTGTTVHWVLPAAIH
ncbi:MAG TPA: hypothetical protein VFU71_02255 [Burkholderiaceae bacterium]|nr:hypothetical protein [Burkholderiaceae bacterium]